MIQGHLAYFGITGNGERLRTVVHKAERTWLMKPRAAETKSVEAERSGWD
jgi:hypothetical protein